MIRNSFLAGLFSIAWVAHATAQPDTLWVPYGEGTRPYAIVYGARSMEDRSKLVGRYAYDTTRIAVVIDHKRGTPSGVYRAYYPDGEPLIFAVYGWGSLHGDWTEYDPAGRVMLKGQYRMGKREGLWAFRKEGIVGHYRDGLAHGRWKYYDAQGRLMRSERYRKGKLAQGGTFLFFTPRKDP